jgi:hypothetical protein
MVVFPTFITSSSRLVPRKLLSSCQLEFGFDENGTYTVARAKILRATKSIMRPTAKSLRKVSLWNNNEEWEKCLK